MFDKNEFPFIAPERCLSELGEFDLSADVQRKLLHDNAARILGLG